MSATAAIAATVAAAPTVPVVLMPPREADVFSLLCRRAVNGEVTILLAEVATAMSVSERAVWAVMRALRDRGLLTSRRRGNRNRPSIYDIRTDIVVQSGYLPRGGVKAGTSGDERDASRAAEVAALLAIVAAHEGQPCPTNSAMAAAIHVTPFRIETLLSQAIAGGQLVRDWEGRARRLIVVATGAATGFATIAGRSLEQRDSILYAARRVADIEAQRAEEDARRVIRDRCPFCEMPPGDAGCRHGWDGRTTRGQRRDMAIAAGRTL